MAAIGEASAIAGLITLTLQVTDTINQYVTAVKDRSKNIRELRDELELLGEVLSQLKDFLASEQSRGRSFDQHSVLKKAVRDCTARIERVGDKLKPPENGKLGRAWDHFKWPFEQKDVIQMVENLRRFTNIFQFAVTVEGCNTVSRTSEEAAIGLRETLDKLNASSVMLSGLGMSVQEISEQMIRVEQVMCLIPILDETVAGIREMSYSMRLAEERELRRRTTEILDWLAPVSTLQKHGGIQEKRTPGTGKWFLQNETFVRWVHDRQAPHDLLAVGRPGVGKSMLSSIVIDHLRQICKDGDAAIVYYYCDYADQQAQTPLHFATSLLRQLTSFCSSVPAAVADFYERTRHDSKDQTWFGELQTVLKRVIATFNQCFFVVDAIDEMEAGFQRDGLFEVLSSIRAAKGSPKIFATTRPHLHVEDEFQEVAKIEINADPTDLRAHLVRMIDQHKTARAFMDDSLKNEILEKLCGNAHGIFLLPSLQVRSVLRHVTRSGVKRALNSLSTELSEVFASTIDRIRGLHQEERDVASATLMWLSYAKRALRVDELQHALAVRLEDDDLDGDNMVPLSTIIDSCCGLVEVVDNMSEDDAHSGDSKGPIVRLIHFSLGEYLRSHAHGVFDQGDTKLARICLKYMSFKSMRTLAPKNRADFQMEVAKLALLDYACLEWGHHACSVAVDEIRDLAVPLLNSGQHLLVIARVCDLKTPDFRKWRERMDAWAFSGGGGISVASSFGLTELAELLIKQTKAPVLNARNMYGSTALHEAARLGYETTAELLISNGADLLDINKGKNTPIYLAVGSKQLSTVRALLQHGRTQLDRACKDGWTPLHKAADLGDSKMLTLLLQSGALVAALDHRRMTPLHLAARRGHLDIAMLLISAGAMVHVYDIDGLTPLDHSATVGHMELVRFFLANGAVPGHITADGWTAIHRAARGGHMSVVELLLEQNVDLLLPNLKGNIPLHVAVRSGRKEVVVMLLDSRPEIRYEQLFRKDKKGATPREVAFYTANFEIHKYLRAAEREFVPVDLNPAANLTAAIEAGNIEEVRQLIQANAADLEDPDEDGQPPLHVAIQENQQAIAELLIKHGASIESVGYHGWRPIHIAASRGNRALLELCLQHGANVNAPTATNQTPLHKACSSPSLAVVQRLLKAGADVSAINHGGMTALSVAAQQNNIEVCRLLVLEHDVDVFHRDNNHDTAASRAEKSGHLELATFLRAQEKRAVRVGRRNLDQSANAAP